MDRRIGITDGVVEESVASREAVGQFGGIEVVRGDNMDGAVDRDCMVCGLGRG